MHIASLVEMDAMIATLEFVANSDWMTILPTTICFSDLDGRIRTLHPLVGPTLSVDYVLIERATGALSAPAMLFMECLRLHRDAIHACWTEMLEPSGPLP